MNDNKKINEQTTADITQQLFTGSGISGAVIERDGMRRCLGCMEEYPSEYDICPECGYSISQEIENALHMFPGTILHDKYIIGKVIGYGGFGVTYLAWDTVLRTKVAIKEYLPSEFSTRAMGQTQITVFSGDKSKQFNDGMQKFIDEAKRLAKFRNENGIVKVFDSFNENGTAYIVMEYLQGETLAQRLEREKTLPVEDSIQMLMPIIESLNRVHDEGIIHRDIAPDNIFITNDGKVKLIDFGAARYATTSRSRSLTVIIKPGYSAEEQYRSRGDQGPHTDVYSVGACLYRMITGVTPPDAMERRAQFEKNHHDMLKPIKKYCKDIDPKRANAIYNAMNVRIEDRTSDMISLAGELTSEEPVKRRRSGIKKIDLLHWPLWAKIGVPTGLATAVTLCILLLFGVIGPKDDFGQYVPDGMTVVPDIVNIAEDKAEAKLEKYDLSPVKGERLESDYYKRGLILGQDPDALNVVLPKSEVVMLLSDGFGEAPVPEVIGHQKELAQTEIEKEGFKVEFVEVELGTKEYQKITETEYADGMVCGQDPAPGTLMERVNTTVTLYVSVVKLGTADKKVPDITGKSFDEAKALLKKAGLLVGEVTYEYNASLPTDQVLGQYPLAGETLKENSGVNLTVNKGAEKVVVPDFYRKSVEAAQQMAQDCGLRISLKAEESTEVDEGLVFKQSIAKEKQVEKGTIITLTYSVKKTVTVPDVTGMTEKKATQTLQDAGLVVSVRYELSDKAKGTVLSQDPTGGKADYKSTVYLVVSTTKEEEVGDKGSNEKKSGSLISIEISSQPSKTEYLIGEKFSKNGMKVLASYGNGTTKDVTDKCTFSQVSAFTSAGQQQVTVSYSEDGLTKTATVRVTVLSAGITMDDTSITLSVGQTKTISARTTNTKEKISWSSSNTSVATVDSSGRVKGVSAGNAVITASVNVNGTIVKDSCSVQVVSDEITATDITVSPKTLELYVGRSQTLTATTTPSNATSSVTWSSSDSGIATVNDSGEVTAKGAGKATITVTANGHSDTCSVEVKASEGKNISSVSVTKKNYDPLYPGDLFDRSQITLQVNYSDGTTQLLQNGFDVSESPDDRTKTGPHVFTVSYQGKSDTFTVNYNRASITLDPHEYTFTKSGTKQIRAVITPAGDGVIWTSTNPTVATVDDKGVVTAKTNGQTTIKAVTDHKQEDTCKITVNVNKTITSISMSKSPAKTVYYDGDSIDLSGLQLLCSYSDGSSETLSYAPNQGIKANPTSAPSPENGVSGSRTINVEYSGFPGKSVSYSITVKKARVTNISEDSSHPSGSTHVELIADTDPADQKAKVSWSVVGSKNAYAVPPYTGSRGAFEASVSGSYTVQAKFSYNGTDRTLEKTITLKASSDVFDHIEASCSGELMIGDEGETVKRALNVRKVMADGSSSSLVSGAFSISPNKIVKGTTQIEVSANSKTIRVPIRVKTPNVSINKSSISLQLTQYYENNDLIRNEKSNTETLSVSTNYDGISFKWTTDSPYDKCLAWGGGNTASITVGLENGLDGTHNSDYSGTTVIRCKVERNGEEIGTVQCSVDMKFKVEKSTPLLTVDTLSFEKYSNVNSKSFTSTVEWDENQLKSQIGTVYIKYSDGTWEDVSIWNCTVTNTGAQTGPDGLFAGQQFNISYKGYTIYCVVQR